MSTESVVDAARAIAFALQPRLLPARNPLYRELVNRYRQTDDFRQLVDGIAVGLGLYVLDASDHGIILGASSDSLFAYRLAEWRRRTGASSEERLLHGLAFLGTAAACFPQPRDLEESDVRYATVNSVERFLRTTCEELQRRLGDTDPRDDQPELEQAWRIYLRRQPTRDTPDGRRGVSTTSAFIAAALEFLEEAGMLHRVSDEEGDRYRTTTRFRTQVRELAAREGYEMLTTAYASTPHDRVED